MIPITTFSGVANSATYLHDPLGRRIRKTAGSQTTFFVWDGTRILAEYDGTGSRTARYAYTGGLTPVQFVREGGGSEQVYDVHTGRGGAARVLTDDTGAVAWRAENRVYGEAVVDPASTVVFNPRLPGQYFDAESGLHDNVLRSYDPALGRYLQPDPFGQSGGLNLYLYANADPLNFVDPVGATPIGLGSDPLADPNPSCISFSCGEPPPPPPPDSGGCGDVGDPTPGGDPAPGDPDVPNAGDGGIATPVPGQPTQRKHLEITVQEILKIGKQTYLGPGQEAYLAETSQAFNIVVRMAGDGAVTVFVILTTNSGSNTQTLDPFTITEGSGIPGLGQTIHPPDGGKTGAEVINQGPGTAIIVIEGIPSI